MRDIRLLTYLLAYPFQLGLAIPPWVGVMSTSDGRYTATATAGEKTASSA